MIAGAAIAPATIALNFTGVAVLKGQGSAEVTLTLNLTLTLTLTLTLPLPLTLSLPPTPTPNQVREKVTADVAPTWLTGACHWSRPWPQP